MCVSPCVCTPFICTLLYYCSRLCATCCLLNSRAYPHAEDTEDNMLILAQHRAHGLLPLGLRTGQSAAQRAIAQDAGSGRVNGGCKLR